MQMYLSRASLFSISLLVGLVVGYMPAIWFFQSGGKNMLNATTYIDTSYTTLRGVIRGVDTKSRTLVIAAVSPYSPYESALFSVNFDDSTLIRSAPASPGLPNLFLPTSDVQEIDANRLVTGTPVTVRVSRHPGPLHAFWIVVRTPIH